MVFFKNIQDRKVETPFSFWFPWWEQLVKPFSSFFEQEWEHGIFQALKFVATYFNTMQVLRAKATLSIIVIVSRKQGTYPVDDFFIRHPQAAHWGFSSAGGEAAISHEHTA